MPWQGAIQILLPIARALDYALCQNIIHRDVEPSNILITSDGDPLLTDFGIAKIIDEEATQDLTGTSAARGYNSKHGHYYSRLVISRCDVVDAGLYQPLQHAGYHHPQPA